MELNIEGKNALIMCGSSGVGLSCVKILANEGVNVTAISRGLIERPTLPSESYKGSVSWITADITNEKDIDDIIKQRPYIDIIIYIPVRERNSSFTDLQEDEFSESYQKTFFPYLRLMKAYLPHMKMRKYGRFINLLGASTLAPLWDHALSNVSRISVVSLASSSAREFSVDGITFNNLILGVFETAGLMKLWKNRTSENKNINKYRKERIEKIPGKEIGKPEQCGMIAALICSPMMSYLNGQSIHVDGGISLTI